MSINLEHADDWGAQRDALSAYLDGRLAPDEGAALHHHMQTCARCSQELVELRQVVALLRALPAPALPRSFAVPVGDGAGSTSASRIADVPSAAPQPSPWPRVAQWVGGLVAAAGLIVGVAGTVGHVPLANYGAGTAVQSSNSPPQAGPLGAPTASASAADRATTTARSANGGTFGPLLGATPTGVLVPSPTPANTRHSAPSSLSEAPSPTLPVVPIAGGALLVVGATTFAAGTRSRRRQR